MDILIQKLKHNYKTLLDYANQLDKSGGVQRKGPTENGLSHLFQQCYKGFVYAVVMADKQLEREEVEAVNFLFDQNWDYGDVKAGQQLFEAGDIQEDPQSALALLKSVQSCEEILGEAHSMTQDYLNLFEDTGYFLAEVDGDFHEDESSTILNYLEHLKSVAKEEMPDVIDLDNAYIPEDTTPMGATQDEDPLRPMLEALSQFQGPLKERLHQILDLMKLQSLKQSKGLPVPPLPLNFIFCGNPGTGKTHATYLIAQICQLQGVISQDKVTEVSAQRFAQCPLHLLGAQVSDCIQQAQGGVLLIHQMTELLASGAFTTQGYVVMDSLYQALKTEPDLLVILSGGPELNHVFYGGHFAFKSLFQTPIPFRDLSTQSQYELLEKKCASHQLQLTPEARDLAQAAFDWMGEGDSSRWRNGELAQVVFSHLLRHQARRLADATTLTEADLREVTRTDLAYALKGGLA